MDDLRLARDAVGIDRCDEERLGATLELLRSANQSMDDDELLALAKERLRKLSEQFLNEQWHREFDPRNRAAIESLRRILLAPAEGGPLKALVIRRSVLRDYSEVDLQPDGLRKREDHWLRRLAEHVQERLDAEALAQRPTEILMLLAPFLDGPTAYLKHAVTRIDGLRLPDLTDEDVLQCIEIVAQYSIAASYAVSVLPLFGITPTDADLWIVHMFYAMLSRPLTDAADQRILAQLFDAHGKDRDAFRAAWLRHDPGLLTRWRVALQQCHEGCMYGRTRELASLCRPHHHIMCLELLDEGAVAIEERTIGAMLTDRYGRISSFVGP